jgi:hypothetical protein
MSAGWEVARKREQEEKLRAAGIEEPANMLEGRIADDAPPTEADLRPTYYVSND